MSYLDFVVLVVPAIIGVGAALWLGPNRGTLLGGAAGVVCVLLLLMFQVTPPEPGQPGSETSRLGYAYGLMMFEWYRWLPSLLIGAAAGSLIYRSRSSRRSS
jgi:hypothetical protein